MKPSSFQDPLVITMVANLSEAILSRGLDLNFSVMAKFRLQVLHMVFVGEVQRGSNTRQYLGKLAAAIGIRLTYRKLRPSPAPLEVYCTKLTFSS